MADSSTSAAAAAAAARAFDIELWTLYAFGVLVTALRTYARWDAIGFKNFSADDFLVWGAILFYTCQSSLAYSIGAFAGGLANNGLTDAERAAISSDSVEYAQRVLGSKIQVVGWTCYALLVGLLKMSMLTFYIRLTAGLSRRYRMPIWIGFGLVSSSIIASILSILVSCIPFANYWQISPDPGNVCQAAVSKPIIWTNFSSNVVTDIYLILIPLPLLWESSLKLIKKIAASIVLSAGIFVLVCAILKTYFVFADAANGAQLAGAWGTREAFVAVCTTNLPLVFPLLKMWLRPFFGSVLRSSGKDYQYKGPNGFRTIGGGGGTGTRERNVRGPSKVNPITANLSLNDSEERIISDIKMQNFGKPVNGIVISSEVQVTSEDRGGHHSEDHAADVHDDWRSGGL
ncbi:hypothetical protein BX600DRAFT_546055 [Xylariales sp. PMI_506]|nr:hypothetical protein BX600DRAFT_546055 [Xylariales sp. PMI_506]